MGALKPHKIPKADLASVQAIYEKIDNREERYELNLYIAGEDEAPEEPVAAAVGAPEDSAAGQGTAEASEADTGASEDAGNGTEGSTEQ